MKKIIFLLVILCLFGCSYSVYTSGFPHLKTIKIESFDNETTQYQFEENVLRQLMDKFQDDGRLKLANLNPNSMLSGNILDYSHKIREYGVSNVDEYQVRILFKVTLMDLINNEIIWQNNSLSLSENYSQTDENSGFNSEEEAQNEIISKLFLKIINESLEQW